MALLGSGFDPGVTNVFATYIKKHLLDRIDTLDILDCNGGDHGQPFATNFNPEINIREVTAPARHWENGRVGRDARRSRRSRPSTSIRSAPKNMYLMYHEELESLAKHLPEIKRIRFWMTFGEQYLKHLEVLQNVGMTRIDPVMYEGREIIPLQFLKAVLPEPASARRDHQGQDQYRRHRDRRRRTARRKTVYVYNICDHEEAYRETGNQAVSYTTGVPAMIGAAMMLTGRGAARACSTWSSSIPIRSWTMLNEHGLPWQVKELDGAAAILTAMDGTPMATRAAIRAPSRDFDLARVPSPCFVVDKAAIEAQSARCSPMSATAAGVKVLLALKAFSMWSLGDLVVASISTASATSGLWEARLGREHFGGEVATYCAGYKAADLPEVLRPVRPCHLQHPRPVAALPRRRSRRRGPRASVRSRPAAQSDAFRRRGRPIRSLPSRTAPRPSRRPADGRAISTASTASTSTRCASRISRRSRRTWEALRPRLEPYFGAAQVAQFRRRPPHHPRRLPARRSGRVPASEVRAETGARRLSRARRGGRARRRHPGRRGARRASTTACRSRSSTSRPPATCPT